MFNLVHDPATLMVAWARVRVIAVPQCRADGVVCSHIENHVGVEPFLRDLRARLKDGTTAPAGSGTGDPQESGKVRRLGIPAVADRVVQMALKLVIEPVFEPGQYRSSYAYRPDAGRTMR